MKLSYLRIKKGLILGFFVLTLSLCLLENTKNITLKTDPLLITNNSKLRGNLLYSPTQIAQNYISIDGNQELIIQVNISGWKGSGTETDPYIIEGLNKPSDTDGWLEIRNTNLFCIIRDCTFLSFDKAITLHNVSNVHVSENEVSSCREDGIVLNYSSNIIVSNNKIFDTLWSAISIRYGKNNSVKKNILKTNGDGISLRCSNGTEISDNTIEDSRATNVELSQSHFTEIEYNVVQRSKYSGISLYDSTNNIIQYNNISDHGERGIRLERSGNNFINNNTFVNNGMVIRGETLNHFIQSKVSNNSVNGKALIYWYNQTNKKVPENAGQVILVNSTAIDVSSLEIYSNSVGIILAFTNDSHIHLNHFRGCWWGIYLHGSLNNTIDSNTLDYVLSTAIYLYHSHNNTMLNNTCIGTGEIAHHSSIGIFSWCSRSNRISRNTITQCTASGMSNFNSNYTWISNNFVFENHKGSDVERCYNTAIINNTFSENSYRGTKVSGGGNFTIIGNTFTFSTNGLQISLTPNGVIANNTFSHNKLYALKLHRCNNVKVVMNSFIQNNENTNKSQASDEIRHDTTQYNIFYLNYWDEWVNPDTNNDGIVDIPYQIDGSANNSDSFPLVSVVSSYSTIPEINSLSQPSVTSESTPYIGIKWILLIICVIALLITKHKVYVQNNHQIPSGTKSDT